MVEPVRKPNSRKEVSTSKFYFFDVGVTNTLRAVTSVEEGTDYFGQVFEQFISQELRAALDYQRVRQPLRFWRTHSQTEVDFVVGDQLAIEVKGSTSASSRMTKGLRAFRKQFEVQHLCLVSRDPIERIEDGIQFLPYQKFLRKLWAGEWFR